MSVLVTGPTVTQKCCRPTTNPEQIESEWSWRKHSGKHQTRVVRSSRPRSATLRNVDKVDLSAQSPALGARPPGRCLSATVDTPVVLSTFALPPLQRSSPRRQPSVHPPACRRPSQRRRKTDEVAARVDVSLRNSCRRDAFMPGKPASYIATGAVRPVHPSRLSSL